MSGQSSLFGAPTPVERTAPSEVPPTDVIVVGPYTMAACANCQDATKHIELVRGNRQCAACGCVSGAVR